MKHLTSTIAVLGALTLTPALASADRGFYGRRMAVGFSLGLGGMSDSGGSIECINCNYGTLSGEFAAHLGGFVAPRVALLAELQFNAQTLSTDGRDDTLLVQTGFMGAVQYWATPRFWLKGGLGFAHLTIDDSYFSMTVDNGVAIMAAAGYELASSRAFSVDLQGRVLNGMYSGIDENITAYTIGVGANWF